MGAFCPAQDSSFTASAGGRFLLNPALDRSFFGIGTMIHEYPFEATLIPLFL